MKRLVTAQIVIAGLALATPALADTRVCSGAVSGPAGQHAVRLVMEDRVVVRGLASWSPPNQTAVAGRDFSPILTLYYRLTDIGTGAHGPLMSAHVIMAANMRETRATEASVRIRRYGETDWFRTRSWDHFGDARSGRDHDLVWLRGSTSFSEADDLALFSTAPQIEAQAVTNLNEALSSGVWNLTYRVALDPLLDRAFQEASRRASRNDCERPNDIERALLQIRD